MSKSRPSTNSNTTPRPMSPEATEEAARADRDAQPLSKADLQRMKRTPQAKIIRRALELTQEADRGEFASDKQVRRTMSKWTGRKQTRRAG